MTALKGWEGIKGFYVGLELMFYWSGTGCISLLMSIVILDSIGSEGVVM